MFDDKFTDFHITIETIFLDAGNEEEAKLLIRDGTNVNATDEEDGNSALILAAEKGETIQRVITPFYRGILKNDKNHQLKLPRYLRYNQSNLRLEKIIIQLGSVNMLELLIENGADLNIVNKVNNSALITAISKGEPLKKV